MKVNDNGLINKGILQAPCKPFAGCTTKAKNYYKRSYPPLFNSALFIHSTSIYCYYGIAYSGVEERISESPASKIPMAPTR